MQHVRTDRAVRGSVRRLPQLHGSRPRIAALMGSEATGLIAALGRRECRAEAADRLADHLGAAAVYVFVTHPDASTKLIPAPALARTLPSSRGWRDLLTRALIPGLHVASVAFPSPSETSP